MTFNLLLKSKKVYKQTFIYYLPRYVSFFINSDEEEGKYITKYGSISLIYLVRSLNPLKKFYGTSLLQEKHENFKILGSKIKMI